MGTTWQLAGIKSVDPTHMRVGVIELLDGVEVNRYAKVFLKSLSDDVILNQLALLVRQKRQQAVDDRVPFNSLNLADFETRVNSS